MQVIPLRKLGIVLISKAFLFVIIFYWQIKAWVLCKYMYALTVTNDGLFSHLVFDSSEPIVIVLLVAVMILASTWIALRPFDRHKTKSYLIVLISIGTPGLILLIVLTQLVLEMPRWFEPSLIILIAGIVFVNSMNTVSLAAEGFESEFTRGEVI
jgi:putative ABC transport system permease protein